MSGSAVCRAMVRWLALAVLAGATACSPGPPAADDTITGPFAALLSASEDLGNAREDRVELTAALREASRPESLIGWAGRHGLAVRWRAGDRWATVSGPPPALASALEVAIHDYRGRLGQVFYASAQQPAVPAELRTEVEGFGRILGYTPHHESSPRIVPLDVPNKALNPTELLRTYNVDALRRQGYTGKGVTVLVFAFDGFDQSDLDMFTESFQLPPLVPELLGPMASERTGEAAMDLQAVHAVAPDARTVLVNARPTVEGDASYRKIAEMMEEADRRYPGAVWSFSIGWGCDALITAADLAPVRGALAAAQRNGTTAFNASGDLAGLECKGGHNWSSPPGPGDIGLDSVASLPEMTSVGGTRLSTDAEGNWLSEQSWFDPVLSQGTGGGVSALFERPPWQSGLPVDAPARRLTPDVAGLADPFTGMRIFLKGEMVVGGGTSLAAPLWAGMAAVMNQYLIENGGHPIGDLNPLLYEIAEGARLPGFRDVVLGGNAVGNAGPGYDLTTGLGTPNAGNLARNLLAVQRQMGLR
ncbi:MAG: peptidase S53 [Mycobacterium sp.]